MSPSTKDWCLITNNNDPTRLQPRLALCICTYKRVQLLKLLLRDVLSQTIQPGIIIIVDGDPASGQVLDMLRSIQFPNDVSIYFIPSNHANLSYQRYLGWLAAENMGISFFLYLDDDLRLKHEGAILKVVEPLTWEHDRIVGVTAETKTGDAAKLIGEQILIDNRNQKDHAPSFLVRHFGAAKNIEPGGLSPSGHRKQPIPAPSGMAEVKWLQGRVMSYSFQALKRDCFSDDLFSITAIHCGLGEDTFLSTRVGVGGKMMFVFNAGFEHPDDALPNSYPIQAYEFGYATAYSRRLLNDNYRFMRPPAFPDRLALIKSYLGTALLNWWSAISRFQRHRLAYAWGYTLGAVRGLIQKPTARNLTPHINWWADAEEALSKKVIVQ